MATRSRKRLIPHSLPQVKILGTKPKYYAHIEYHKCRNTKGITLQWQLVNCVLIKRTLNEKIVKLGLDKGALL